MAGELEVVTAEHLVDVLSATVVDEPPDSVCIDMAGVSFLDAAGMCALVRPKTHLDDLGATLILFNVSMRLRRLLRIAGRVCCTDL